MPALKKPSNHFRRDIQGLRALAVLAVIGDHVLHWPAGGYLGVDVFFVISGFLITSLLVRELDRSSRVSLRDFYVRRIKRILPLAALVLLATLAAGYATFNSARFTSTAIDEAWAMVFGANWRFAAVGTDYFQNQGPVSPIQHYWSLSVEEQFYLVWPLVLVILLVVTRNRARRTRLAVLAGVMALIVVASFAFALTDTAANPAVAYFSTFTRAWELGVGVLLGLSAGLWSRLPQVLRPALSWAGLLGILASFWLVDTSHPVPGPWAALPVLACALVIVAGIDAQNVACAPLTNRVSGYLGDLSYSLYLWHFPVLVLAESSLPTGSPALLPFVFATTALLSVGSHHLLEQPTIRSPWLAHGLSSDQRSRRWRQWRGDMGPEIRRSALGVFAGTTALVVTIALVPPAPPQSALALPDAAASAPEGGAGTGTGATSTPTASAGKTEPAATPAVATLQKEIRQALESTAWPALEPTIDAVLDGSRKGSAYLKCGSSDENGLSQDACTWGPEAAAKKVVLVGDSTAMHYLDTFAEMAQAEGSTWRLSNRAMFACPFVDIRIQNDTAGIIGACQKHNNDTLAYLAEAKPDLVIVTNSYQQLTDDETKSTVTSARWKAGLTTYLDAVAATGAGILGVASPPDDADIATCYSKNSTPSSCVTRTPKTWRNLDSADQAVFESYKGKLIDPRPMMCLQDLCPAYIGTTPVKEDRVHLTTAFALKLVPAMSETLRAAGSY